MLEDRDHRFHGDFQFLENSGASVTFVPYHIGRSFESRIEARNSTCLAAKIEARKRYGGDVKVSIEDSK